MQVLYVVDTGLGSIIIGNNSFTYNYFFDIIVISIEKHESIMAIFLLSKENDKYGKYY